MTVVAVIAAGSSAERRVFLLRFILTVLKSSVSISSIEERADNLLADGVEVGSGVGSSEVEVKGCSKVVVGIGAGCGILSCQATCSRPLKNSF